MTSLMGEEKAVDIGYLAFTKASDAVSHKILIEKLRKCSLGGWTVK